MILPIICSFRGKKFGENIKKISQRLNNDVTNTGLDFALKDQALATPSRRLKANILWIHLIEPDTREITHSIK